MDPPDDHARARSPTRVAVDPRAREYERPHPPVRPRRHANSSSARLEAQPQRAGSRTGAPTCGRWMSYQLAPACSKVLPEKMRSLSLALRRGRDLALPAQTTMKPCSDKRAEEVLGTLTPRGCLHPASAPAQNGCAYTPGGSLLKPACASASARSEGKALRCSVPPAPCPATARLSEQTKTLVLGEKRRAMPGVFVEPIKDRCGPSARALDPPDVRREREVHGFLAESPQAAATCNRSAHRDRWRPSQRSPEHDLISGRFRNQLQYWFYRHRADRMSGR